jgi:hypothetical protein
MKNNEFHKPFIKNLFFIGAMTIFCMVFVRIISLSYFSTPSNSLEYTTHRSNIMEESGNK